MANRFDEIFSAIESCSVFADIGCDHGYMTEKVLKSGKCDKAIISDVSEKCLEKAKTLLFGYIESGKCEYFACDGFDKITYCDQALIAGMGGEETIKILKKSSFKPEKLVLQPMKSVKELRLFLVSFGYKIEKDYLFTASGKYYTLIKASLGRDFLTEEEAEFGRTNISLLPSDFTSWISKEIEKLCAYSKAENISEGSRKEINLRIEKLQKYV